MNESKNEQLSDYNYRHFNADYYEFDEFTGLKEGDKFVDFELRTADGISAKISDFLEAV